jgi:hypothetical protein
MILVSQILQLRHDFVPFDLEENRRRQDWSRRNSWVEQTGSQFMNPQKNKMSTNGCRQPSSLRDFFKEAL